MSCFLNNHIDNIIYTYNREVITISKSSQEVLQEVIDTIEPLRGVLNVGVLNDEVRKNIMQIEMEKTGELIGAKAVHQDQEIMMITNEGILIRIAVADISVLGRITSGVKLMNVDLESNVFVASVSKVRKEENGENGDNADDVKNTDSDMKSFQEGSLREGSTQKESSQETIESDTER